MKNNSDIAHSQNVRTLDAASEPLPVLYVTSSSFSGSTFLSFLLNTHPAMTTVGEMEGWETANLETFRCSCGSVFDSCPFFGKVAQVFAAHGLPFSLHDFGTGYRLVRRIRWNRYLTGALPVLHSSTLEQARDRLVAAIPAFAHRIELSNRANALFVRTVVSLTGARVFVNADKSPHRLRLLKNVPKMDLRPLHLIRDPRGVVLTFMENRGWDAATGMRVWMREQQDILRIVSEFDARQQLYYEDLCDDVDAVLARVHRFAGVPARPFDGEFRSVEHHILGNAMRLDNVGRIVKSERWKKKLAPADIQTITGMARNYVLRHHDGLSAILRRYLDS